MLLSRKNISGVRVIQSLSREELNSRHFDQVNRAHFKANLDAARLPLSRMMPAVELLMTLAIALLVLFGGTGVLNGTLLVGSLMAFILYVQRFFDPIRILTMEYAQLQRAMASGSRIFELLDAETEMAKKESVSVPRLKGEITFEEVSFSYAPEI